MMSCWEDRLSVKALMSCGTPGMAIPSAFMQVTGTVLAQGRSGLESYEDWACFDDDEFRANAGLREGSAILALPVTENQEHPA